MINRNNSLDLSASYGEGLTGEKKLKEHDGMSISKKG